MILTFPVVWELLGKLHPRTFFLPSKAHLPNGHDSISTQFPPLSFTSGSTSQSLCDTGHVYKRSVSQFSPCKMGIINTYRIRLLGDYRRGDRERTWYIISSGNNWLIFLLMMSAHMSMGPGSVLISGTEKSRLRILQTGFPFVKPEPT